MSTKNNPGAFRCYEAALPDEHVFTILARDPAGPATLRFWADERERVGKTVNPDDRDRIEDARRDALLMEDWRERNLDPLGDGSGPSWKMVKITDDDGGPIRDLPRQPTYIPAERDGTEAVRLNVEWLMARTRDLVEGRMSREEYTNLIELACQSPDRRRDFTGVEEAEDSLLYRLEGAIHNLRDGRLPAPHDLYRAVKKQVLIHVENEPAPSPWNYECIGLGLSDLEAILQRLRRTKPAEQVWYDYADTEQENPIPVQPLSFVRMSELLDYATAYGEFDENTPSGTEAKDPRMSSPMNDMRRAAIWQLKRCMGIIPEGAEPPVADDGPSPNITLAIRAEGLFKVPGIDAPQTMDQIAAAYRKAAESVAKSPTLDSAPEDLAHAPEVPHHRFSVFHEAGDYAYARGLEVSPMHLATALDAMAKSGWHLCAIFGQTDAQHIGFIFRRETQRYTAFELAHGYGGGFDRETFERAIIESPELQRFKAGEPLDTIREEKPCAPDDAECLERIGMGRGQMP